MKNRSRHFRQSASPGKSAIAAIAVGCTIGLLAHAIVRAHGDIQSTSPRTDSQQQDAALLTSGEEETIVKMDFGAVTYDGNRLGVEVLIQTDFAAPARRSRCSERQR